MCSCTGFTTAFYQLGGQSQLTISKPITMHHRYTTLDIIIIILNILKFKSVWWPHSMSWLGYYYIQFYRLFNIAFLGIGTAQYSIRF